MKVGDEVTEFTRPKNLRVEPQPFRISKIKRITKTLFILESGSRYEIRNPTGLKLTCPADQEFLAKLRERRELEEKERQAHHELICSLGKLFTADLWVNSSNQDGRFDLCNLTEHQLRLCAEKLAEQPEKERIER